MKNIVAGGFILLSGIILFVGIHMATVQFLPNITGWSTPPGRYVTALKESGGQPASLFAVLLCIAGLLVIAWECILGKAFRSLLDTIKRRDEENQRKNDSDF